MPPRLTCLVILSACLFGSAFGANTFFVATTGSDNVPNDGSSALPFREIRRALTGINAGDTVLVIAPVERLVALEARNRPLPSRSSARDDPREAVPIG